MVDNASMISYTLVLPCLNEERTLSDCVNEAKKGAEDGEMSIEIIVADNGSTDNSPLIAKELGCKVVFVKTKGYGAALDAGIRKASHEYIVMGDSDMSYDFKEAPRLIHLLNSGADAVIGNRFEGGIESGAMPFHHKYLGNPVLSALARIFFKLKIRDFHCGLRAVRKSKYLAANPRSTGMEFATEMILRLNLVNAVVKETPVKLRKDGRDRKPHLRSFPDGWRHLKMMLLFAPHYFLFYPGMFLSLFSLSQIILFSIFGKVDLFFGIGMVSYAVINLSFFIIGISLLTASFINFALAKTKNVSFFRLGNKILDVAVSNTFFRFGVIILLISQFVIIEYVYEWVNSNFGAIDPMYGIRLLLPITCLFYLGMQISIGSILTRQILSKFW